MALAFQGPMIALKMSATTLPNTTETTLLYATCSHSCIIEIDPMS